MTGVIDTVQPRDLKDVEEAIGAANGRLLTVEIRGGGTKADIGRPEAADLILDMGGFAAVIDYDPPELVLTAGAGTPLATIEDLLARSGQQLAFEPLDLGPLLGGAARRATLGGVLATNACGPRRPFAGAARDHFLGFEGISGRGETFKAGGKVVKNVTGYDLPKLLGGSWGTLAALTSVTVKVLPRAKASATLILRGLDPIAAVKTMNEAMGAPAPVTGAAYLPAGLESSGLEGPAVVIRLEGVEASVAAGLSILPQGDVLDGAATTALWAAVRDVGPFVGRPGIVWRLSVPPSEGAKVLAQLGKVGEAFLDWGGGLVWLLAPQSFESSVRRTVAEVGGHATLIRAPAEVRAEIATFQPEAPALKALSSRVRFAFDPNGVLGPRHRIAGT